MCSYLSLSASDRGGGMGVALRMACLAWLLIAARTVHADMVLAGSDEVLVTEHARAGQPARHAVQAENRNEFLTRLDRREPALAGYAMALRLGGLRVLGAASPDERQHPQALSNAVAVPPAPESAALGLVGLSTLGLWGASRSVRKLRLSDLPDWCATERLRQVRHVTPLNLEFSRSNMPTCRFEAPASAGNEEFPP